MKRVAVKGISLVMMVLMLGLCLAGCGGTGEKLSDPSKTTKRKWWI